MRRRILLAVAVALAIATFACTHTAAFAEPRSAEIAMEVQTETVLHSSDVDVQLPMASTTKIMTALLVAEDCDLDRVVTVPDSAVGAEGSSIYLKRGEEIDVRDLLYGLMLRSGNDAAEALAVIHSGSREAFIERMNARARELGAQNTNFTNPSGLPDESHYTTARDLCKIACAAMRNEVFRQVVGTKSWKGRFRSYSNKNKMLFNYDGATGVKTGYTKRAGRCLVSSAQRGGMEVVCVVLNVGDMYARSAAILDSCFKDYEVVQLNADSRFMCGGKICALCGEHTLVIGRGTELRFEVVPDAPQAGEEAGKLKIYSQNNLIFADNLYSIV